MSRSNNKKKVLILDNYDSFVCNIFQYVGMQGALPSVYRNDELTIEGIKSRRPDGIIISPGPGTPCNQRDFGVCTKVLRTISRKIPTLGICLGHQGIGYAYGAEISLAKVAMHGKPSMVKHVGSGIFDGLPNPLLATRYHSLVIKNVPDALEVTAMSMDDGEVMGVKHKDLPIFGIQFHPESIMTRDGVKIISNFLDML
ncbi:MAG: aminodeoxychorismate/anthranilate synthase component II [Nitrososphaerota archaeon]|nr:aminodeoxychorismate/anthranilate synthase component II [Nitrososphaerota archaeon]